MASYEDFLRAYQEAGFTDKNFSQEDMTMARMNPDAGLAIIQAKKDWQNATTSEARALANAAAEKVRNNYGGYTAGHDGMGYTNHGAADKGASSSISGDNRAYTYADFTRAVNDAGFKTSNGDYSNTDLIMAAMNPEAGIALNRAKQQYRAAADDEARAKANAEAERIRGTYGGYTGGANGSGFTASAGTAGALPTPTQSGGSITDYNSLQQAAASGGMTIPAGLAQVAQAIPELIPELAQLMGLTTATTAPAANATPSVTPSANIPYGADKAAGLIGDSAGTKQILPTPLYPDRDIYFVGDEKGLGGNLTAPVPDIGEITDPKPVESTESVDVGDVSNSNAINRVLREDKVKTALEKNKGVISWQDWQELIKKGYTDEQLARTGLRLPV